MDWPAISPVEAGLDPAKLEAWRSSLSAHGTTGLIIIRRGRIALEWYAPEWNQNRPHGTASMAKALVGGMSLAVAMSDWRISPDDPASKYIAAWNGTYKTITQTMASDSNTARVMRRSYFSVFANRSSIVVQCFSVAAASWIGVSLGTQPWNAS